MTNPHGAVGGGVDAVEPTGERVESVADVAAAAAAGTAMALRWVDDNARVWQPQAHAEINTQINMRNKEKRGGSDAHVQK
jgi:hypothetical protein